MGKLIGTLIWLGFLLVLGPVLVGVIFALARWLFLGLAVIAVLGVALLALLALLE